MKTAECGRRARSRRVPRRQRLRPLPARKTPNPIPLLRLTTSRLPIALISGDIWAWRAKLRPLPVFSVAEDPVEDLPAAASKGDLSITIDDASSLRALQRTARGERQGCAISAVDAVPAELSGRESDQQSGGRDQLRSLRTGTAHARLRRRSAGRHDYIRAARKGESILALNGEKYSLSAEDIVIADAQKPVGIAGIIGGNDTAIRATTKRIVLEAASFPAAPVRKSSSRLKLRTDASMRFEKGQDPENTVRALARAVELLKQISPGSRPPRPLTFTRANQRRPKSSSISIGLSASWDASFRRKK